jgi:hypothetical protein
MADYLGFFFIVCMASLIVYFLHALKTMREELGVCRRLLALEQAVFPKPIEPAKPVAPTKPARKAPAQKTAK